MLQLSAMSQPRPFRDRPWRRIGVSLAIAMALHGVLIGAGVWAFRDYLSGISYDPPAPERLTRQSLDQAIADAPASGFGVQIGDAEGAINEPVIRSPGWVATRWFSAREAALPFDYGWISDHRLVMPIAPPAYIPPRPAQK